MSGPVPADTWTIFQAKWRCQRCGRTATRPQRADWDAGLAELEAENERLRGEVQKMKDYGDRAVHRLNETRWDPDAARRELADLRAGVEALARDGEAGGEGSSPYLARRLWALPGMEDQ